MNVAIDEAKCCAAGQCALAAPDVFDQSEDDGIVILLDASPPEDQHSSAIRTAADLCPAAAITVGV